MSIRRHVTSRLPTTLRTSPLPWYGWPGWLGESVSLMLRLLCFFFSGGGQGMGRSWRPGAAVMAGTGVAMAH